MGISEISPPVRDNSATGSSQQHREEAVGPHSQAGDLQEEQPFLGELCGGALGSGEVVGWRGAKDTLRLCCSLHSEVGAGNLF